MEEELREKLEADIVAYQRDSGITTTTPDKDKTDHHVAAIVAPIANGKIKLLQFISALGPSITTQDPLVRSKSVRLLSLTLGRLAIDTCLLDAELDHLFEFLLLRVEDHHLVAPAALLGLRAISSSARLPSNNAIRLLRAVFDHVHVQSLAQGDRFSVYIVFRNLLAKHLHQVKVAMGADFVHGFVQTMDGEKDPRNLVICFELAEKISQVFSLGAFTEDMFEVVACYFPIDFHQPKNDPFGVSKEMLVSGLERAMTASPGFAPYCLPLVIEKLTSDLTSAKLDALRLLSAAAPVFGPKGLREHLELLTVDLRREMLTSMSDPVLSAVSNAGTAVAKTVADDRLGQDFPELLPHFTALVLKECGNYLNEPQHRLMDPASRLLLAFCRGSLYVTVRVIQSTFPSLHKHFMTSSQLNSRCPIVEVMGKFLRVLCDHVQPTKLREEESGTSQSKEPLLPRSVMTLADVTIEEVPSRTVMRHEGMPSPLEEENSTSLPPPPFTGFEEGSELYDVRQPMLQVLQTSLTHPDEKLSQLGIAATEACLHLPKAVDDEEQVKTIIFQLVFAAVFSRSPKVRHAAVGAVQRLHLRPCGSQGEDNLFDAHVLPVLINHLTEAVSKLGVDDEAMEVDGAPRGEADPKSLSNCTNLCHLISSTCTTPTAFATATDKLLTAAETEGGGSASGHLFLQCLNMLADKGMKGSKVNQDVLKNKVLMRVKSIFIDDWESSDWLRDSLVVEEGAALVRRVVQIMTADEATREWEETRGLLGSHLLEGGSGQSKAMLFPLVVAVGASVPRGCHIHQSRDFMQALLSRATSDATDATTHTTVAHLASATQLAACKLFAAILNKIEDDGALSPLLDQVTAQVTARLHANSVRLWVWVTKALVLRSHRLSKQFTKQLVTWLSGHDAGDKQQQDVASFIGTNAFATILSPAADVLTLDQHGIVRRMHEQRFFLQTIPLLILPAQQQQQNPEEDESSKKHHLNSIASMLPFLPKQVLLSELPNILPVLITALCCEDVVALQSVIKSFFLLLAESPLSLACHTDAVIPKLVRLAQESPAMDVRADALKCLRVMVRSESCADGAVGFAPSILMPHKTTVIQALSRCIDDKKRLVRREAVLARNDWWMI